MNEDMAAPQNIRIKIVVTVEEIELVSGLFRQSNWPLSEVGELENVEDKPELFQWTLDVTEDQRDAVIYAVDGEVLSIWEEPPAQAKPQGRRQMVLELTDVQEDRLRQFMQEENWPEEDVMRGYVEQENLPEGDDRDDGAMPDNIPRYVVVQRRDGFEECLECFAQPCVMHPNNKQEWWPQQPAAASAHNHVYRRRLYRDFHTMLYHRGIWGDERYLAKKANMEGATIRREVMPDCVCRWVRYWYPNPPGIPYMGHKNA